MSRCYLLLGTNLGDKLFNLEEATRNISVRIGEIITKSSIYETKAWGKTDQGDFLNQVIEVYSSDTVLSILDSCLSIESQMGRVREEKWGERLIDIDILYHGDSILSSEDLRIPHKELQNRRFTLVPLAEIAPDFVHPVFGKTNNQLLSDCTDALEVSLVEVMTD